MPPRRASARCPTLWPSSADGWGSGTASVEIKKLVRRYGPLEVVHAIDLLIADGEFIVLVGPPGCGKSTTLRMLAGLEDISDGEILIEANRQRDRAARPRYRHGIPASTWSNRTCSMRHPAERSAKRRTDLIRSARLRHSAGALVVFPARWVYCKTLTLRPANRKA
jgi:energy-coupling factor transporter ATP-binding protein EcfA2